ncbi:MAG TPA: DUF5666 domain-containing protein [Solirubrobacterales bacterium]|nr:DUF5666 domain-containing protein [Solirubrobacterales bacterium]
MIRGRAALFATVVLAGALAVGLVAAPAQAALRHIDGTVVSKNSDNRTFKLSTQGGTVRIKVNGTTKFDRIAGFGSLHKGMKVEVDAQTTSNGLVAKQVEPQGGGGGGDHGGGGGADDGPNHT